MHTNAGKPVEVTIKLTYEDAERLLQVADLKYTNQDVRILNVLRMALTNGHGH